MNEIIDHALQAVILIGSAIAIAGVASADQRRKRIASIVGILAQPAWLCSAWHAGHWGTFLLAVWFLIVYAATLITSIDPLPDDQFHINPMDFRRP